MNPFNHSLMPLLKQGLCLSLFFFAAVALFAQKRIAPTVEQIERVMRTSTSVVLTGENMLLDAALRSAVEKNWTITPVTFIDTAELHRTLSDANRTFLLFVGGTFRDDATQNGYTFLNFVMGGGLEPNQLADFVLWPVTCSGQSEDRALVFMDAFIDIIQQHLRTVQNNPKLAKADMDAYNSAIQRLPTLSIWIAEDDMTYDMTEADREGFDGHLHLVSYDAIADALERRAERTAVGLSLFPLDDRLKDTYCYNLIIACDTHELLYFKRHKVRRPQQRGFLKEEIYRLSLPFKLKPKK
jgi:hypothetical protein